MRRRRRRRCIESLVWPSRSQCSFALLLPLAELKISSSCARLRLRGEVARNFAANGAEGLAPRTQTRRLMSCCCCCCFVSARDSNNNNNCQTFTLEVCRVATGGDILKCQYVRVAANTHTQARAAAQDKSVGGGGAEIHARRKCAKSGSMRAERAKC